MTSVRRLIERYQGWRYRRTYGAKADRSRALAEIDKRRKG